MRRHAIEHRGAGLPSAAWTAAISPVCRCSVPLTISSTRPAPARRATSATEAAAGMPKITSSIWLNTTRPLFVMALALLVPPAHYRRHRADRKRVRPATAL